MKKIFNSLFISLFFQILMFSQEGWFSQYSGTMNAFLCVFAIDENHAWIGSQEDGTVLSTTDGGETWNHILIDSNKRVTSINFINQNLGWCILSDFRIGDIYKTTDGGLNWYKKFSDSTNISSVYFINENIGWAVGHSYMNGKPGRLVKSTDGGENWVLTHTFELNDYPERVCFLNENTGFIGCDSRPGKIFKSIDGGYNWNATIIASAFYALSFADSLFGIVVGHLGKYVITTDSGASWDEFFSGQDESIRGVSNRYPLIWMTSYLYILYSSDNGEKWFPQTVGNPHTHDVFFVNDTVGWAVGGYGEIYKTINGGQPTVSYPQTPNLLLPSIGDTSNFPVHFEWGEIEYSAYQLQVSSDSLFYDIVLDTRRIPYYFFCYELNTFSKYYWRLRSENINGYSEWSQIHYFYTGITGIDDNNNTIFTYSLSQNYPNPFNPSTAIKYQIPEISLVTLKVYDILGSEVATLVNEEKPAGSYEVQFNSHSVEGRNLTSGIYFYQLKAGDFAETKKMILLR